MIWRIIDSGMATLNELELFWNFDDIIRAISYLDIQYEIEQTLMPKVKK